MDVSGNIVVGAVASYLLGSVSFALLAGKLRGIDVRLQGSGNLGATNAGRVLGRPLGFAIFVLDCLKGFVPALWFPAVVLLRGPSVWSATSLGLLFGLCAVLGHMFPFYLGFRGGKGVATGAGVFLALAPIATVIVLAVWAVVLFASRYMSLASMIAAVMLPVAIVVMGRVAGAGGEGSLLPMAAAAVALLVIVRHRANIRRILQGTEKRIGEHA